MSGGILSNCRTASGNGNEYFRKGEPERQTIARQQAEQAWTGKPENIRSFDEGVDGFKYQVRLNDLAEVQSVTKTADRPYRGQFGYRKLLYVKVVFCTSKLW
ncbi:hypothetical protein RFG91_004783 [Klebsiella aerogenes]|nr:hypothetical protein [Klebsiella aerogenes]